MRTGVHSFIGNLIMGVHCLNNVCILVKFRGCKTLLLKIHPLLTHPLSCYTPFYPKFFCWSKTNLFLVEAKPGSRWNSHFSGKKDLPICCFPLLNVIFLEVMLLDESATTPLTCYIQITTHWGFQIKDIILS